MAFPLAINEIGSINSKYNSERIVEIFRKELEWKWFYYMLISSLLLIVVYVSGRVFGYSIRFNHLLIWTIFICTILLSAFLILFANKVMTYKSDITLKKYLLEEDKNRFKLKEEILDLYIYFLRKDSGYNDSELWSYFSKYFLNKRTNQTISDEDLRILNRLNSVVLEGTSNDYELLQYNVSAGEWLIGRHEYAGRINRYIYSYVWQNLKLALTENKTHVLIGYYGSICASYFSQMMPAVTVQKMPF